MGRLLTIAFFLLTIRAAISEDIYVSQNSAGGDTGADAANAHSMTWANTAGNWGAGAGKISAGDTLHLCGTLTSTLSVQAAGTAGSPITILFESGAKFSAPTWTGNVISGSSLNYIIIDGGANGLIEATANGSGLAYSNNFWCVNLAGNAGLEVKNLTLTNMYRRVVSSDELAAHGVLLDGPLTNCSVHHCSVSWAGRGIELDLRGGINASAYSNTCTYVGFGVFDNALSGTVISNSVYGNRVDHFEVWDGLFVGGGWNHNDGIIINATVNATNLAPRFYGNNCGPHVGNGAQQSGFIFMRPDSPAQIQDALIYNNFSIAESGGNPANGHIYAAATRTLIANNTIVGNGSGGICIGTGPGTIILNNLAYLQSQGIYQSEGWTTNSDYNVWNNCDTFSADGTGSPTYTWSGWTNATRFDFHSTTNAPTLDASYVPTGADTVARGKGTNLSAYFTTDFYGNARPGVGAWTIGAFEGASQAQPPASGGTATFGSGVSFGAGVKSL